MGIEKPLSETAKRADTEHIEVMRGKRLEATAQQYKMSVADLNGLQYSPRSEEQLELIIGTVNGLDVWAITRNDGTHLVRLNNTSLPAGDSEQAWRRLLGAVESRDAVNRVAVSGIESEISFNHRFQNDADMIALRDQFWGGESPEHEGFSPRVNEEDQELPEAA